MKHEKDKMWNLEYWNGSKFIETIKTNQPYGICKVTMKKLQKQQNYKLGKFLIKENINEN